MSEVLLELIKLGGGFAGIVSVVYLLWRKLRKNIRIYNISGTYETEELDNKGFHNITATIEVGFLNDSDETVSITDVVGSLRYNKELYEKAFSSAINIPKIPEVYAKRPNNFHEVVHFSIAPHETVKKTIVITFQNMITDLIDRIGFAYFVGFLDGKIPFFQSSERELKEKWSAHPLTLLLSTHINGKRIYNTHITLFKKGEKEIFGSLGFLGVEKIKRDYRDGRL